MSLQSKTFADLVNFARASTATYVDADGTIKTAAIDAPRFDWSTGRRSLLLEASATNLLLRSANFELPSWIKTDFVHVPVTLSNGIVGSEINRAETPGYAIYNETATNWIVPNTNSPAPTNGRVSVTFTTPAGCTSARLYPIRRETPARHVYSVIPVIPLTTYVASWFEESGKIGGLQVEAGPTATSYIPTAGSAVTRAADIASIKGLTAGTYDRRRVTPSGTSDTTGIVHPGGDIALAPGAYYQSIYYPGGTL